MSEDIPVVPGNHQWHKAEAEMAGALQPDGAPPERIDFELCQRIGKAARDAAGRFAHLISGATAPDPVATDEYVGLAILRELGARLPEPGRTAE